MIKNKKTELNKKIFQKDYDKQLIIKKFRKAINIPRNDY